MLSVDQPAHLQDDLAVFRKIALKHASTSHEVASNLAGVHRALMQLDYRRYDLAKHREAAPALLREIFNFQSAIRARVPMWQEQGLMTRDVQKATRDLLRSTRYAGDVLGEIWIGDNRLSEDDQTLDAFTGDNHNTLTGERFPANGEIPFATGDVIIMRGRLHNSAAIARIGDIDSQFSHVGMVYIDDKDRHWFVEALIEEGAHIVPLKEALSHGVGRAAVFRHRDTDLAKRSAQKIYKHVRHSRSGLGKPIQYDFTMRLDRGHNLFCSEVVYRAFKKGSNRKVRLPTYKTRLDMKNRDLLDRIGVKTIETFAPGDIELEPDFDLVAEWRDHRVLSELRVKDFVMDKLLEWMERDNFRFEETFTIKLISVFGRISSYLSNDVKNLIKSVFPKVPSNMSRRAIAAIAMLHSTAEPFSDRLLDLNAHRVRTTGIPMPPGEILAELEAHRANAGDEIGYLKIKKT